MNVLGACKDSSRLGSGSSRRRTARLLMVSSILGFGSCNMSNGVDVKLELWVLLLLIIGTLVRRAV